MVSYIKMHSGHVVELTVWFNHKKYIYQIGEILRDSNIVNHDFSPVKQASEISMHVQIVDLSYNVSVNISI